MRTGHNSSLGLGQVVVSTAKKNDLLSDLIPEQSRKNSGNERIAKLLTSDEVNIFAVAKYLRIVANMGAGKSISSLPSTRAQYPGINMAAYAKNSSQWPDDNVKALGSEYTSRPWDDKVFANWGDFVFEAYKDVKSSKVF